MVCTQVGDDVPQTEPVMAKPCSRTTSGPALPVSSYSMGPADSSTSATTPSHQTMLPGVPAVAGIKWFQRKPSPAHAADRAGPRSSSVAQLMPLPEVR